MAETTRARWDWLRELAARHRAVDTDARERRRAHDALVMAIGRIGFAFEALVDGVAEVLGTSREDLLAPSDAAIARIDGELLAALVPALLQHDDARMRRVASALVNVPSTIYAVPADAGAQWLVDSSALAQMLTERVRDEGLAWLGPVHLARLAEDGATPALRSTCAAWRDRIAGVAA